ncbi:MAG TPA: hypothetical protein VFA12_14090 [Stellaceae bacterium]|nr:hypothetical protein [Stellaceae bacterium]
MRKLAFPVFAAATLLALPAFAQGTVSNSSSPGSNPAAASNPSPSAMKLTQETRQRIHQSLQQAGYKDIQIMPEAFLIRAQSPDGSRFVMQVSPDMLAQNGTSGSSSSSMSSAQSGSSTTPGSNAAIVDESQKITQALQQNGFKDVKVLPEAFLIRAQAPDGSHMVMQVSPDQAEGLITPPTSSGSSSNGGTGGSPNSQMGR